MHTNGPEALGALTLVLRRPSFVIVFAAHLLFLILACWAALTPEPRGRDSVGRSVNLALLVSALPLCLSAALTDYLPSPQHQHSSLPRGNNPFTYAPEARPHPLFGAATLASPLGSAEEIASMKARVHIWNREHGYRRSRATAPTTVTEPILAIFYIGESVRADGYGPDQRDRGSASRRLAERIDAGLGSWLPTTCASSDGTAISVPLLLTATTPANMSEAPRAPTVLGILKAAGFATAWLANNYAGPDGQERGHDLYAGVFNVNPDDLYGDKLEQWIFDGDMLPRAKQFTGAVLEPKALIMHSIGSHIPYDARYPDHIFPAEPADLARDQRTELRYVRSLEYGASVILDVAAILDSAAAPAFLVYTSDHGENLPHDGNGLKVHLAQRTSSEDGTVPAFVLWNKAMAVSGRPARLLPKLVAARSIAHADISRLFLALGGMTDTPVEPTARPSIWGRVSLGDDYGVVPCADLKP